MWQHCNHIPYLYGPQLLFKIFFWQEIVDFCEIVIDNFAHVFYSKAFYNVNQQHLCLQICV